MVIFFMMGCLWCVIFVFFILFFFGNVVQQFYQFVDVIVVGWYFGVIFFVVVGVIGSLLFLLFGFVWGLISGFVILIVQVFGVCDDVVVC